MSPVSAFVAVVLGLGAAFFAGLALLTRRVFAAAAALAAMGTFVAALLVVSGFAELGVTALACAWGVAAAGLVIGRSLSETEARERAAHGAVPRGPWLLALAASLLLAAALGLGIFVVDWPLGRARRAGAADAGSVTFAGWALGVLGAASALALAATSPGSERE